MYKVNILVLVAKLPIQPLPFELVILQAVLIFYVLVKWSFKVDQIHKVTYQSLPTKKNPKSIANYFGPKQYKQQKPMLPQFHDCDRANT